jgi:hypothetical protein
MTERISPVTVRGSLVRAGMNPLLAAELREELAGIRIFFHVQGDNFQHSPGSAWRIISARSGGYV